MESFRIGDVTIERVIPKTAPDETAKADERGSASTSGTEDGQVVASSPPEDQPATNGSPKTDSPSNPGDSKPVAVENPQDESGGENPVDSGLPQDRGHEHNMDVDDVDVKVERVPAEVPDDKEPKEEPGEDDEEEEEDEDYPLEDDPDELMSAQSGEEGDGKEEEEDDEEEDEDVGDAEEEDEEDTLRELAEAVSRGEVEGEVAEGEGDAPAAEVEGEAGQEPKKKIKKRKKGASEEGGEGSDPEKKKKRKLKKKKKGATGKDGTKDGEKEGSSEDGSASDGEGGEKKKKKGKKGKKGKKKSEDGEEDDKAGKGKLSNLRRNIREVMDETQLDEATLAAQRQEMERLRRVQEQQRLIREYQRQMAQTRQNSKTEQRVLSLLQGNTSIVKQVAGTGAPQSSASGSRSPSSLLAKLAGQTPQVGKKVVEVLRVPKGLTAVPTKPGSTMKPSVTRTLVTKPRPLSGAHMMTPSVSIAPVRSASGMKPMLPMKSPMAAMQPPYSGSEGEDDEEEEEEMAEAMERKPGRKGKDVVTISSSSSSEDCIVLSEPSDAGEEEEEEDPTNSGMHTNDLFNVPDEEGRIQVNMGKPEGDPDIFLAPHIARVIKPHQVGGIRFLYDNVVESIERFNTSPGFGCILAHSMGLGKTLQVISFCDIFLRHTPAKTVLCIMPINTLQNWMAEFNMWLPKDPSTSPLSAQGEVRPRNFNIHVLNDSHKTLKARAKVVDEWQKDGGVLLIGYELYRLLSLKRPTKPKKSRRKKPPVEEEEPLDPEEEGKKEKEMLEAVYAALVKPGPDLVICDEGHRIKNSHASISMALKQIRSKRRVVLTGYPLQNNLLEYWCMVDFVRPNYLGTKTEFCNMFERPIQNGQCIDSTPQDIRLMRYRAHVLHSLLEGFVQRRSHSVLQNSLPQKEEYVLLVRMTAFQRKLYDTFMNEVVRTKAVPNPLKAFAVCCKIWNHPDVLYQFLRKREGGEGVDLDLEEAAASLAPTTVEATEEGGVPIPGAAAPRPATGGRSRAKGGRTRNPSGAKRSRKGAAANKPAAAVIPNTSSQPDSSNVFSGNQGGSYPPMHGQSNMMPYNAYPPPATQQGHTQYQQSFGSMPHHYPESNNSYGGYGSGGFSGSSMPMSGQGNFPNAGYNDPVPPPSSSFGSSSQQMFPSSNPPPSTPSSSQGYDNMNAPYFSGNSNSSAQHGMGDNFQPAGGYDQNWSGSGTNYDFNQSQQGSQSFPDQNYSQGGSFQGYNAPPAAEAGFSQNMYNAPAAPSSASSTATGSSSSNGTTASGSGTAPPNTSGSGYPPPGMMAQPPTQQNNQPGMMMGNQGMMPQPQQPRMNAGNMMIPPSPVNSSGMLPGGAPDELMMHGRRQRRPLPPGVQESPVNASGMLPGGAPTKDLMMPGKNQGMLPGMGSSMGPRMMGNMSDRMMHMDSGMGGLGPGMGPDGMMPHHGQDMAMYSSQGMMGNQPLPSMGGGDVPTAEDLLRSESEDFAPFDGSVDMMSGMNKKQDMYGIKSDSSRMFDPWANSHNQGYGMGNSYKQDNMKMDNSYTDMKAGIVKMKNDRDDKYPMDGVSLTELKSDMDLKSKETMDSMKGMDSDERKWQVDSMEMIDKEKEDEMKRKEDGREDEEEEPILGPDGKPAIEVTGPGKVPTNSREDPGIPYDWAVELMKDYTPGLIENSAKMAIFFCMLEESLLLGDRILVFSQSLFTLSLIEEFLQRNYIPLPGVHEKWQRNRTYYRLDGSTAALEREKLINEFNQNPGVHMFLVSTRAGSLGINLVGANRVIVFDASWNPCHDTQAVCRVYRYGQKKPCFVYRLVMDNCLEKKIYDRQINKQGMSDRVVDECNPDAHLSIKEVTNLCWDDEKETEVVDFAKEKDKFDDIVMQKVLEKYGKFLSRLYKRKWALRGRWTDPKDRSTEICSAATPGVPSSMPSLTTVPFHHESLLVDRKDKKLSQAEKRLAKRSYEMEKRANNRPVYHYYNSGAPGGLQISRAVQRDGSIVKPIASVRPMQAEMNMDRGPGGMLRQGSQPGRTKWIPADVWQRQGMTAQEMTLPLDVVIPTNSPDRTSIVLKAGQRVMVLKSPKGIYMQLESGKIIAIRTAFKMGGNKGDNKMGPDKDDMKKGILGKSGAKLPSGIHPLRNNPNITITPRGSPGGPRGIRPNVLQTRAVPTRLSSPIGRGNWHARPGLAGRGVTVRPTGAGLRAGIRPISPSVTVTPSISRTPSASVSIFPKGGAGFPKHMDDQGEGSHLPGSQGDSLGGSQGGSLGGSRPTSQAGSDDGQNSNSSQDTPNHAKSFKNSRVPPTHETDDLGEVPDKAWMDEDEDPSTMGKAHDDEGSQHYLDAALSSHSQSSNFTTGSDYTEGLPTSKSLADANRGERIHEHDDPDAERGASPNSEELTKPNKNFRHRQSNLGENKSRDDGFGGNMFRQNQAVNFSSGFSVSSRGSFESSSMMGSYRGAEAEEDDRARTRKSPAASRGRKMPQYLEGDAPSIDSGNQWKSPQQFSPGMSSKASQQRSLESPAYDDNSNASANSNMSAKSSSANAPSDRLQTSSEDYFNNSQPSKNQASSTVTKTPVTAASDPPTPTPPASSSGNYPPPPGAAPVMDPYLYGGYGSYPPPPSGYYSPYGHPMPAPPLHQQPYAPGYFPDRNASAPAPSSAPAAPPTVPATPAAPSAPAEPPPAPAPAAPPKDDASRHQSTSSKSSTTTESSKKAAPRARPEVPPPAGYDGRSNSGPSNTPNASNSGSPPATPVDPAAYPAGSSSTSNPYNPMMPIPAYNSSSQYPPPAAPVNSSAPPPATSPNVFSAAAAGNYPPAPYTAPYAYPGSNQFESDFGRASMYSAFHRPDPGQFPAPGPIDSAAPYLPPLPAHSRPMNPAYPPQNMYPGQYGGARDPYGQLPPYPASPFIMPPAPYSGLSVSPAATPSASSTDQPQSQ